MECAIVVPPGPWTNGSAHWIICLARQSLGHSVIKKALLSYKRWPFGNYVIPPQAVPWVVLACVDETYVNHCIISGMCFN